MAHQAHNLPWGSLASNFDVKRNAGNNLDIWALDLPTQPKSLVHFAKVFATNLRENAGIERRKYAPAKDSRQRASTWMTSQQYEGTSTRRRQAKQAETRKVYSDHDKNVWTARWAMDSQDTLRGNTQNIDNWLEGSRLWAPGVLDESGRPVATSPYWYTRDLWVGAWTDVIKLLMMDAAMCTTPLKLRQTVRNAGSSKEREHLDTLFLLVHHPRLQDSIKAWTSECDQCCNMESGIVCIIEAALQAYIYFNLVYTMREAGSRVCDEDQSTPFIDVWAKRLIRDPLFPRPKYMNTRSWRRLLHLVNKGHSHHPQSTMYVPYLYPAKNENFTISCADSISQPLGQPSQDQEVRLNRTEVDIMNARESGCDEEAINPVARPGSAAALKEFLRGLWSLLVNFEMLWSDIGEAPEWDLMVAEMLEDLFRGISGKYNSLFMHDVYTNGLQHVLKGETSFPMIRGTRRRRSATLEEVPVEIAVSQSQKNKEARGLARREARRTKRARENHT
ncbi:hypothetical protein BDZ85DRAFT_83118 [Elsinoe ampelina]|uniref:Uncharacterized protein n=1 Tax=Elsinoe ampelina TaxID=302913 RepID=A0A6A6GGA7_9PEZI|nr:hypothetical protein BDZ85DRAFT_83118 [Elsinoe ampelina]